MKSSRATTERGGGGTWSKKSVRANTAVPDAAAAASLTPSSNPPSMNDHWLTRNPIEVAIRATARSPIQAKRGRMSFAVGFPSNLSNSAMTRHAAAVTASLKGRTHRRCRLSSRPNFTIRPNTCSLQLRSSSHTRLPSVVKQRCHPEPFGSAQGGLREGSGRGLVDPGFPPPRFLVAPLLGMTYSMANWYHSPFPHSVNIVPGPAVRDHADLTEGPSPSTALHLNPAARQRTRGCARRPCFAFSTRASSRALSRRRCPGGPTSAGAEPAIPCG